jgi:transcriptional regulator with XRE-family HTH domain
VHGIINGNQVNKAPGTLARRDRLLGSLSEYMGKTELPKAEIARGMGTSASAIYKWIDGTNKPRPATLDRIENFLERQSAPGLTREEVLKAFEWFCRESSLTDAGIAREMGFYPLTLYAWNVGRYEPNYASLKKIESYLREKAPEYLRGD